MTDLEMLVKTKEKFLTVKEWVRTETYGKIEEPCVFCKKYWPNGLMVPRHRCMGCPLNSLPGAAPEARIGCMRNDMRHVLKQSGINLGCDSVTLYRTEHSKDSVEQRMNATKWVDWFLAEIDVLIQQEG